MRGVCNKMATLGVHRLQIDGPDNLFSRALRRGSSAASCCRSDNLQPQVLTELAPLSRAAGRFSPIPRRKVRHRSRRAGHLAPETPAGLQGCWLCGDASCWPTVGIGGGRCGAGGDVNHSNSVGGAEVGSRGHRFRSFVALAHSAPRFRHRAPRLYPAPANNLSAAPRDNRSCSREFRYVRMHP